MSLKTSKLKSRIRIESQRAAKKERLIMEALNGERRCKFTVEILDGSRLDFYGLIRLFKIEPNGSQVIIVADRNYR